MVLWIARFGVTSLGRGLAFMLGCCVCMGFVLLVVRLLRLLFMIGFGFVCYVVEFWAVGGLQVVLLGVLIVVLGTFVYSLYVCCWVYDCGDMDWCCDIAGGRLGFGNFCVISRCLEFVSW